MTRRSRQPRRSAADYRQRRRAMSHEDAMAGGGRDHLPEVPEHPLIPPGDPEAVTSTEGLRAFLEHAREAGAFAYDTEFIGELTYFPKLCLVQLATTQRLAIVDPTDATIDLTPLWEAIADPALETIVHAGMQDLEPVVRFLDRAPAGVFDTQIAAAFIGLPYPLGLRKLVQELTGAQVAKGMTFTQWDHRPLSSLHRRYAADDVRYLPAVRARLRERLEGLGHAAWAREECAQLTQVSNYRFDADSQLLRVKGSDGLDGQGLAILRELVALRDTLAREQDLPPRSLLKDELLIRLVRPPVESLEQLQEARGMPRPLVRRDGLRLLEAVSRGRALDPIKRPTLMREEDGRDRVRIDGLMAALSGWCLGRSVDPALVMGRADVASLYFRLRRGRATVSGRLRQGWRGELLEPWIERFLSGGTALALRWNTDEGLEASLGD